MRLNDPDCFKKSRRFFGFRRISQNQKKAAVFLSVLLFSCSLAVLPGGRVCGGQETAVVSEERKDPADELYALSAVLMDADNGRILLQKNETQVLPMASTTKIMTCILALELADMEEYVTVSSYAAGMPKVHLGTREGQVFLLKDLLYSLMLESHNDSAVIIAEHIGRKLSGNTQTESRDAVLCFAEKMNEKAEAIGCTDTFFVTPNGLDAILTLTDETGRTVEKQHSTTAADLARIMSYCVTDSPQKEAFLEITRTDSYTFTDYVPAKEEGGGWTAGSSSYSCTNHNAFLSMMEGALTGKTGFTAKAGYCYVGALRRDGKTFSIALLACGWPGNRSWKWHDARLLYEYGLAHYEKQDIYRRETLPALPVLEGVKDHAEISQEQAQIRLLLGASDEVCTQLQLTESLEAPVEEGQTVGWQNYYVNGTLYASLPIRTAERVEKRTFRYCLEELLKQVWL
ncbi:MAG TPA: D-alanyl-D-alanine carboxypeptidase [Candidatus Eisenbergiella intestinipullorum]|nr:D-alanyl-D-alanine carboxypeptidase [Candidatus Eisenbergiella intestinipullorum]